MANLPESSSFEAGVYQLETTDEVLGGVNGKSNIQGKQLANRTRWLKNQVDALNALKGKGVSAFSTANSYAGGDQVIYQKNIWRANTTISPGTWNPSQWTRQLGTNAEIDVSTVGAAMAVAANKEAGRAAIDAASLDSPTFTGNPKAPTPNQFTTDTSLVNAAFVQRALGNYQGVLFVTEDVSLTASQAGNIVAFFSLTTKTVTLPALSTILQGGACFRIVNNTPTAHFVVVQGADSIGFPYFNNSGSGVTSLRLDPGCWIDVAATTGFNTWAVVAENISPHGNLRPSYRLVEGTASLDSSHFGCSVQCNDSGYTITLPPANSARFGTLINFLGYTTGDVTIVPSGSDFLSFNQPGFKYSVTLTRRGTLTLMSNGSDSWTVVAGTDMLPLTSMFERSHGESGYQKLPGGLIIQWGITADPANSPSGSVSVTFPIAFPNKCVALSCIESANSGNKSVWSSALTDTTETGTIFYWYRAQGTAVGPCMYLAIGY